METSDTYDIRRMLTDELIVQKNYLDMVPRPSPEDYNRLKENIEKHGLDPAQPLVANSDMLVLDGFTRLTIAKELNKEWAWVTIRDFGDPQEERRFVIVSALARRHLNEAQRVELGLMLLDIEQEKARARQRIAGDKNLKQYSENQKSRDYSNNLPVRPILAQPKNQGKATELAAKQVGIGRETLRKGHKIQQAAKTDPQIAKAWDNAKQGQGSVDKVFRQVQEKEKEKKEKNELKTESRPGRVPTLPHEEIMYWLYKVANHQGVPREAIDGAIGLEEYLLAVWNWALQEMFSPELAWDLTLFVVNRWKKEQPVEIPVPYDTKNLGPWPLDFVHQVELRDLVGEFPEDTTHLIYSDVVVGLDRVGLLAEFGNRVLKPGKCLCLYVDKRHLPEAMARLSAAGLTYFWSCSAFRPADKQEVPDMLVREKWRLLLVYRKGGESEATWDWFSDSVECRQPSNRDMARQLIKGLTIPGQLVVDPFVGSGITGQVARSLERRFLCFGVDEEDVRAANQRISQVHLAENTNT